MLQKYDCVMAGNNLAVLVAAVERIRRGHRVALLTDGKGLGGHFGGLKIGKHGFDLGMVLLERVASSPDGAALVSYDPRVRNDWVRFGSLAAQWLQARVSLKRAPTPTVRVGTLVGPDYLIANRLDLLAGQNLPAPEPLSLDDPRHALHKNVGRFYDDLTYADAARWHHGATLHDVYIEPFVRKITGLSSDRLLARYHRAVWAPLYYPETLAAAFEGKSTALPEYPFYTTGSGRVGELVDGLCEELAASPNLVKCTEKISALSYDCGRWTVRLEDGSQVMSPRLVLGLPADRVHGLLGLPDLARPESASVVLLLCLVRHDAIGRSLACEMVVDECFATYRVTDQDALAEHDPEWHRVVVEASPLKLRERVGGFAAGRPEAGLLPELQQLMGIENLAGVQMLRCIEAAGALVLPTTAAVAEARAAWERLREATPQAEITGTLLPYGCASLNEQIVQGLKIAQELG